MSFGKASYDPKGPNQDKKPFKAKYKNSYLSGPETGTGPGPIKRFRIFPPMKSLAGDVHGWRRYYSEHWGDYVTGNNPEKPYQFVYGCVERRDWKLKTISHHCGKCDRYAATKESLDNTRNKLKFEGKSEQDIKDVTAPMAQWLKNNRCSRGWMLSVMLDNGEFEVLKLSKDTFKDKLMPLIDELSKDGYDPTDLDSGVWFEAYRQGKGLDATDHITVVKDQVQVAGRPRPISEPRLAPVTEQQRERALDCLPDLATEAVKMLTAEQIQMIAEGSGDPDENLRIISQGERQASNNTPGVVNVPVNVPVRTAPVEPTRQAQARAVVAAAQVQQVEVSKSDGRTMTDEEFLASMGIK